MYFDKINSTSFEKLKNQLEQDYYGFTMKFKKELAQDGRGDCPSDYANNTLSDFLNNEGDFENLYAEKSAKISTQVNVDIIYIFDEKQRLIGKIDLTMKKMRGEILKGIKYIA